MDPEEVWACSETVYAPGDMMPRPCTRKATNQHGDRHYCTQHNPLTRVRSKRDESKRRRREETFREIVSAAKREAEDAEGA